MRKLVIVALLCGCLCAQEIKRPTTDSNSGAATWAVDNCGPATATASPVGTFAYDAAGQATSINYHGQGGRYTVNLISRLFSTWQLPGGTYSSLSLNVNVASLGFSSQGSGAPAQACVLYSTDSGTSWTTLRCDNDGTGWGQQTFSAVLTPTQDLSKLRVGMCIFTDSGGGMEESAGQDNLQIYDIWTIGNTGGSSSSGSKTSGQPHRGLVIVH